MSQEKMYRDTDKNLYQIPESRRAFKFKNMGNIDSNEWSNSTLQTFPIIINDDSADHIIMTWKYRGETWKRVYVSLDVTNQLDVPILLYGQYEHMNGFASSYYTNEDIDGEIILKSKNKFYSDSASVSSRIALSAFLASWDGSSEEDMIADSGDNYGSVFSMTVDANEHKTSYMHDSVSYAFNRMLTMGGWAGIFTVHYILG